jgi:trehalose/maltose hydrolase-like predicted phosphorylase
VAPYPVAVDLALGGVWLSDTLQSVGDQEQSYDFSTGELTSRFVLAVEGTLARVEVTTFCSRTAPTLVCQEAVVEVERAVDVKLRAAVDAGGVPGRALRQTRETPGEDAPACDGALLWEGAGGLSRLGIAYATELSGTDCDPVRPPLIRDRLYTEYGFRAVAGRRYRLRQMASLVPEVMHSQPDRQAVRLCAMARNDGFETLRRENRETWKQLWKGRIKLIGAGERWQQLADAAYFYLNSSVHTSSPASTSIFGLATWHDYHYYYGHVMWDIETFCVPPITFSQPGAAAAILDYRFRNLEAAYRNADLMGRRGAQFPWESAPGHGDEAAPMPGTASWHEDHVSLDVALAFALFAACGDDVRFAGEKAWPVLAGVADWIVCRVHRTRGGYELLKSMGIAERQRTADRAAFSTMSAVVVLREAKVLAERLGRPFNPLWAEIASSLLLPMRDQIVVSHEGYRRDEEKGATPDPLMGVWPLAYRLDPDAERATLEFYLAQAETYIGAPMLSALYGVWAARAGDRELSLRLLEEGYGRFVKGRFLQTLEYRPDRFPEQPQAGPFFANTGGFLSGLLLGFTRLEPSAAEPRAWAKGPVVLPAGWTAIEVDRLWIRGRPVRLVARHGEAARLEDA